MEFMKFTGKTEEDALTEAKIALGATTDEIEYEVLEKGTSGSKMTLKPRPAMEEIRLHLKMYFLSVLSLM